jgi:hypothetical protein
VHIQLKMDAWVLQTESMDKIRHELAGHTFYARDSD